MTIEIIMELTEWLFFWRENSILFMLYDSLDPNFMIPMIYSNIRCKVKKISTGSPVKLSCNIHRYTLQKYEVLCMIQTFFFISSNFNYFVKSKVAQNEKKNPTILSVSIWNFGTILLDNFVWFLKSVLYILELFIDGSWILSKIVLSTPNCMCVMIMFTWEIIMIIA